MSDSYQHHSISLGLILNITLTKDDYVTKKIYGHYCGLYFFWIRFESLSFNLGTIVISGEIEKFQVR